MESQQNSIGPEWMDDETKSFLKDVIMECIREIELSEKHTP